MENLIVCIALYIAIVAIAYCPNKATATDPAAKVDYFPEVETTTDPEPVAMPVQPKAKATIANLIKEEVARPAIAATALSTVAPMATVPAQPVEVFIMPSQDLSALPIRALYAQAKGKVKNYKKLSRVQLIQNLQALA